MFDEKVSTISFNRRCLATAAQWHGRQHVETDARKSYLPSPWRVSAPDGEMKSRPGLGRVFVSVLFVLAS